MKILTIAITRAAIESPNAMPPVSVAVYFTPLALVFVVAAFSSAPGAAAVPVPAAVLSIRLS